MDELVSLIQKSIRRGDVDVALPAVAELDLSGYWRAAAKKLVTCAIEDVGLGYAARCSLTMCAVD